MGTSNSSARVALAPSPCTSNSSTPCITIYSAYNMNLSTQGLERFIVAQDSVYDVALDELAMGEKTTHWMWFVFPQLRALARTPTAKHFGLESKEETLAFWQHPVLGKRLMECTKLLLAQRNSNVHDIFGSPDDLKFRSCMTLFSQVVATEPTFKQALDRFCGGRADEATLKLL
ncbi:DUF1810 domain-containing protein [Candidatus Aalborgicola defluviihabitans]|jgi:uncharacterized protein (DUF1810 family)|uniref:DUF1810 domain-containing protein n=1 Tax=Candidatus Aalborgicola defluviihabitans TaxID=3386187 RepID=UPI0039B84C73